MHEGREENYLQTTEKITLKPINYFHELLLLLLSIVKTQDNHGCGAALLNEENR